MRCLLLLACLLFTATAFAARVDTLAIPSAAMGKTYRAAVVLPASYAKNKKAHYPVLYLLHGAYGHFSDWLKSPADKHLVHKLADQYNLIIVNPEGETFSFYLDSPVKADSKFETYLTQEVIPAIDRAYRTVPDRRGRVITGLSMGGYGALSLSAKHPDLYCAAGSMSGALELSSANRKFTPEETAWRNKNLLPILGAEADNPTFFSTNSVINMADRIHGNGLPLIIDCGVDDGLLEINREMHRRLTYNHTPHDYTERPGGHTWAYWQTALPYQVLFLAQVLKENGVTVPLQ
ncbi:alpha/beta hydrolase [Hymenobacter ruricola]|uniref:Esterase family protein n=1 Tax=Hymenobacter ruricola TaxID=2791023 RepID=A0ABS0I1G4_9BACT|nr:alpha/beta hydrolase family protein [Hymenobacter ruricola]MBF9220588.1 esterase family protein [Hymenobacter ruricola]